ncbi:SGNH/GDSL hydrolase family protein [Crocosphaera sp. UHCC 0190]|uniref:SGNH/GDSL hydrolase family protein n=1 Tax=Crocosphaera sp. UHCC 0190 TaxID=3110246 RepID=UPI002B206350|nr:SGNH/GDSL hydrolase family protein [Crocosphaera sp. UHCC 0190]MEA5510826.1 SGNH/GDSL hydrolase family protein [Crocosphaera sp. UHCC 0190]
MKILFLSLGVILGVLLLLEGCLRLIFGLGQRPLYIADPEIGYLLAPNQNIRRFGKSTIINQYSMRTGEIKPHREENRLRLFLLGDSIANGAWWTDQTETISALMTEDLQTILSEKVEVLNASANSWGPRNQLAYLQRFGTFEAQKIILLMNTDDLFATAPISLVVGKDNNYPDHQPSSAIGEILERLFIRPQPIPGMSELLTEKGDRVGINLQALARINAIATQENSQFMIALTPLKREVEREPKDYEKRARERLEEWTKTHEVVYLDFLPIFKKQEHTLNLYRDHIHLSPLGNQLVSQHISQLVKINN